MNTPTNTNDFDPDALLILAEANPPPTPKPRPIKGNQRLGHWLTDDSKVFEAFERQHQNKRPHVSLITTSADVDEATCMGLDAPFARLHMDPRNPLTDEVIRALSPHKKCPFNNLHPSALPPGTPAPDLQDINAAALLALANEHPLTTESDDEQKQREAEEQREEEISKILSRLMEQSKPLGGAEDYRKTPKKRPMLLVYDPPKGDIYTDTIDFLPQGKVGFFVAPGGTGKTQALVQLAVAVASGRKWFNTFYSPKGPARVLLALGEEDRAEFRRRINPLVDYMCKEFEASDPIDGRRLAGKLLADLQANLTELPLDGINSRLIGPKLSKSGECSETPFFDALCKYVGITLDEQRQPKPTPGFSEGFRLIILDPASRFMGPDCETDNSAATSFIQCVEVLTRAPKKPTIILAHHTRKGSGTSSGKDAARGASALTDGARWSAQLIRERNEDGTYKPDIKMFLDKSNYTPLLKKPLTLRFSEDRKNPWLERVDAEEEAEESAPNRQSPTRRSPKTKKPSKPANNQAIKIDRV